MVTAGSGIPIPASTDSGGLALSTAHSALAFSAATILGFTTDTMAAFVPASITTEGAPLWVGFMGTESQADSTVVDSTVVDFTVADAEVVAAVADRLAAERTCADPPLFYAKKPRGGSADGFCKNEANGSAMYPVVSRLGK